MFVLDKEKIKPIMINELGYTSYEADKLLETLVVIHDDLKDAVDRWVIDRTIQDVNVSGVSLKTIMERRRINFIVAIRYLNRLLDDDLPDQLRTSMISMLQRRFEAE